MNTCEMLRELSRTWEAGRLDAELNEDHTLSWQFCAHSPEADDGTFYTTCQRFLRVLSPAPGYRMTEDAAEPLEVMVKKALDSAQIVDTPSIAGLLPPEGEPWPETLMEDCGYPSLPVDEMRALAGRLWKKISQAAHNMTEAQVTVSALARERLLVNTLGLVRRQVNVHYKIIATLTVKGQTEMNSTTWRVYVPTPEALDEDAFVRDAVFAAQCTLDGGRLASRKYPVVISAPVMAQMLLGFWKVFSGEDILSGGSFLAGCQGKKIAGDALALVDADGFAGTGLKVAFDDEGTLKARSFIIQEGVFETPLYTRETAAQAGAVSTGNAARKDTLGRFIPNALVTAPKIMYLQPSENSLKDLMAGIEDGVYITDIDDIYHAFNFGSGDFSAPCRGVRIKDGKLCGGIRLLNLSDNLKNLFANVTAVGSRVIFCDLEDLDAYYIGGTDVLVSELNLMGDAI